MNNPSNICRISPLKVKITAWSHHLINFENQDLSHIFKRHKQKNQQVTISRIKGDKHLSFKMKLLEEGNWNLQVNANLICDEMS